MTALGVGAEGFTVRRNMCVGNEVVKDSKGHAG
jgi:hypothetical protein